MFCWNNSKSIDSLLKNLLLSKCIQNISITTHLLSPEFIEFLHAFSQQVNGFLEAGAADDVLQKLQHSILVLCEGLGLHHGNLFYFSLVTYTIETDTIETVIIGTSIIQIVTIETVSVLWSSLWFGPLLPGNGYYRNSYHRNTQPVFCEGGLKFHHGDLFYFSLYTITIETVTIETANQCVVKAMVTSWQSALLLPGNSYHINFYFWKCQVLSETQAESWICCLP